MTTEDHARLRRIRMLTALFILGLVWSGATAIPLVREVDWLAKATGAGSLAGNALASAPAWKLWLTRIRLAGVRTFRHRPGLRRRVARSGAESLAVRFWADGLRPGHSLRAGVWGHSRNSALVAGD